MNALALARTLLTRRALVAGSLRLRVEEVEVYLRSPAHPDPFVHAHPSQRPAGRFYFHRAGSGFRGGSFKGLDLTIGGPDAIGGILFRSARTPGGELICGPSLLVDAILDATGARSVAALHEALGDAAAEPRGPLCLAHAPARDLTPLSTARVGLTLRRHRPGDGRDAFLLRRYRLLTDPRAIRKGRVHTVIALHQDGATAEAIAATTGSPRAAVERWLAAYARGERRAALTRDAERGERLAEQHGAWMARFGPQSS